MPSLSSEESGCFPLTQVAAANPRSNSSRSAQVRHRVSSIVPRMTLRTNDAGTAIHEIWEHDVVPQLVDYVRIPALSPAFDADWEAHGHLEAAVQQVVAWIETRDVSGLTCSVQRLDGRTPLIVVEVEPFGHSSTNNTVVLYGHIDKQPEMEGWRDDLGPWTPVIEDGRLYGRGGADDGYAAFASLTAIEAVQKNGGCHARCLLLIEASEESGSPDLPAHVDALAETLGDVDLVLCLDSGCLTYETLWLTTSLRGLAGVDLRVDILTEGVHSGSASGIVPSSFRIVRQLLDRVEDSETGAVLLPSATVEIPGHRVVEAKAVAAELGDTALDDLPLVDGAQIVPSSIAEALIENTWRASLSVVGADGLPPTARAGNVLRPYTTLKLSLRVPPTGNSAAVLRELEETLVANPPYGARVTVERPESADGWNAPALEPWLADALERASQSAFDRPMCLFGEGGTIPFMGMLGEKFPDAQFVITGVLGPESNAHGPNEFLDLAYAEKLTNCLAIVLDTHGSRST